MEETMTMNYENQERVAVNPDLSQSNDATETADGPYLRVVGSPLPSGTGTSLGSMGLCSLARHDGFDFHALLIPGIHASPRRPTPLILPSIGAQAQPIQGFVEDIQAVFPIRKSCT